MSIDEIINHVASLDGRLTCRPRPGDGSPKISWGDVFFYYAPDGQVPNGQPFAAIVTKNSSDEDASQLDRPGALRLNIAAAETPSGRPSSAGATPPLTPAHPTPWCSAPVYDHLGWVAVLLPGERTSCHPLSLPRSTHARARARDQRRDAADHK